MKESQQKLNQTFKTDLYRTMFVLQEISAKINNYEPIDKRLEKEAEECIVIMAHWTSNDQDTTQYIHELKDLLRKQITLSHEIKKQKDTLWKRHVQPTAQKTF